MGAVCVDWESATMKVGDLVRHRDRNHDTHGIVVDVSRHDETTLIDVYWSTFGGDTARTICGYMPSELRPLDENR